MANLRLQAQEAQYKVGQGPTRCLMELYLSRSSNCFQERQAFSKQTAITNEDQTHRIVSRLNIALNFKVPPLKQYLTTTIKLCDLLEVLIGTKLVDGEEYRKHSET